jgi:hypothetical protein
MVGSLYSCGTGPGRASCSGAGEETLPFFACGLSRWLTNEALIVVKRIDYLNANRVAVPYVRRSLREVLTAATIFALPVFVLAVAAPHTTARWRPRNGERSLSILVGVRAEVESIRKNG